MNQRSDAIFRVRAVCGPTISATRPPTPTSTSSKISVGMRPRPASTTCSAKLTCATVTARRDLVLSGFHRLAGIGAHQKLGCAPVRAPRVRPRPRLAARSRICRRACRAPACVALPVCRVCRRPAGAGAKALRRASYKTRVHLLLHLQACRGWCRSFRCRPARCAGRVRCPAGRPASRDACARVRVPTIMRRSTCSSRCGSSSRPSRYRCSRDAGFVNLDRGLAE